MTLGFGGKEGVHEDEQDVRDNVNEYDEDDCVYEDEDTDEAEEDVGEDEERKRVGKQDEQEGAHRPHRTDFVRLKCCSVDRSVDYSVYY